VSAIVGWDYAIALLPTLEPIEAWLAELAHQPSLLDTRAWLRLAEMLQQAVDEKQAHAEELARGEPPPSVEQAADRQRLEEEHREARRTAVDKLNRLQTLVPHLRQLVEAQDDLELHNPVALDRMDDAMNQVVAIPLLAKHRAADAGGLATLSFEDRMDLLVQREAGEPETAAKDSGPDPRRRTSRPERFALGAPLDRASAGWNALLRAEESYLGLLDLAHWLYVTPLAMALRDQGLGVDMVDKSLRTLNGEDRPLRYDPADGGAREPLLPLQDFIAVFWDYLQLMEVHEAFLEDLQAAYEDLARAEGNEDEATALQGLRRCAQTLVSFAEALWPAYRTWLDNLSTALSSLGQNLTRSRALRGFLARAKHSHLAEGATDLWSLLLAPLHRPRFYTWCATELLRLTASQPQREVLTTALNGLQRVATAVQTCLEQARVRAAPSSTKGGAAPRPRPLPVVPADVERCHRFLLLGRHNSTASWFDWHAAGLPLPESTSLADLPRVHTDMLVVVGEAVLYLTRTALTVVDAWEEATALGQVLLSRQQRRWSAPRHSLVGADLIQAQLGDLPGQRLFLRVRLRLDLLQMEEAAAAEDEGTEGEGEDGVADGDEAVLLLHSRDAAALHVWQAALAETEA
jgi:hypothetical protein